MDRFVGAEGLRELLDNGDVKLLRAKWLLENEHWQVLKTVNRQQLEELHPEAFVDEDMVKRLVMEAAGAARKDNSVQKCFYVGIVVVSYCWQTQTHPDPSGSMMDMLSRHLRWYAAQRSKYSRGRLYLDWKVAGLQLKDYSWDFGVLVDFWSLFQLPRTPEQEASFKRSQAAMNVWFGHAGTMKFLLREAPAEWKESQEFVERGGYDRSGWCCFEEQTAWLAGARHCLDMSGFEEMLSTFTPASKEQLTPPEIRAELSQSASRFDLEDLAMEDKDGRSLTEGSCLRPLRIKKPSAPIPPSEILEELRTRRFGYADDMRVCEQGYAQAAEAAMEREDELMLMFLQHWKEEDWARVGRCLAHYSNVRGINFVSSQLGDNGLRAFLSTLAPGHGASVQFMSLHGTCVSGAAMPALAAAVRNGALEALKELYGVTGLDAAATRAVWKQAGRRAEVREGGVGLQRARSVCCALA